MEFIGASSSNVNGEGISCFLREIRRIDEEIKREGCSREEYLSYLKNEFDLDSDDDSFNEIDTIIHFKRGSREDIYVYVKRKSE